MKIVEAVEGDIPKLKEFLLPWESSCVTLCSHIRKKKGHIFIVSNQNPDDIFGVFYFDKTLLYCFPFLEKDNSADKAAAATAAGLIKEFQSVMMDFLDGKKLCCLNGSAKAGQIIIQALEQNGNAPYQTNNYNTMELLQTPLPPPEKLSCDDEIKRCTDPDAELEYLLPLQKMYMAKEVAPAGKQVTDLEASAQLKSILKDQLCFALWTDGEVVAKANTNAIGFDYVQLGGVYTHPLYRKNYYAWNLVYTICTRVLKTGRKLSLFVKERNNPANELYKRIGFVPGGKYIIAYFK